MRRQVRDGLAAQNARLDQLHTRVDTVIDSIADLRIAFLGQAGYTQQPQWQDNQTNQQENFDQSRAQYTPQNTNTGQNTQQGQGNQGSMGHQPQNVGGRQLQQSH